MINLHKGDNKQILEEMAKENKKYNVIYLDPPYNTKNNKLSYNDNFKKNDWYSFFEERLKLILKVVDKKTVIFVSIGHEELGHAKLALNNVFGCANFVSIMPRITNHVAKTTKTISRINDFVIIYKMGNVQFHGAAIDKKPYIFKDNHYKNRGKYQLRRLDYNLFRYSKTLDIAIEFKGKKFYPGAGNKSKFDKRKKEHFEKDWCWLWSKKKIEFAIEHDFIENQGNNLCKKIYTRCEIIRKKKGDYKLLHLKRTQPFNSLELTKTMYANSSSKKRDLEKLFSYPKVDKLLEFLFALPNFKEINILDPFAGTGISAIVAKKLNFNCDLIQIVENANEDSDMKKKGFSNIFDLTKKILDNRKIKVKIYE